MKRVTLKAIQSAAADVQREGQNYGTRSQGYLNAMVRWADLIAAYAGQNPGKKLPANPFRQNPTKRRRPVRKSKRAPRRVPRGYLKSRAALSSKRRRRRRAPAFAAQMKRAGRWITARTFKAKGKALAFAQALANRTRRRCRVYWPGAPGAKPNPSPRELSREAEQAAQLLESFTGHAARRVREIKLPQPRAGLAVGRVHAVVYSATRDGERDLYEHAFRPGARPHLVSSHDGRSLLLLGGAYRFTDRGIVDLK